MKTKEQKKNSFWKNVYLLSLVPLVSIVIYLGMLMGLTDSILYIPDNGFTVEAFLSMLILLAMTFVWAFCGFLFSRSRVSIFPAVIIANAIPIVTTVVYFVLYIVYKFCESDTVLGIAEVIGGLGTGIFGILSEFIYLLVPFSMTLWQVFINFAFQIIVFVVGYSIGASMRKKYSLTKKK